MPDKSRKVKKEPAKPHSVNNPNYQNPSVAKKLSGKEIPATVYENAVIRDDAREASTSLSYTIPSLEGFELELEDPNENAVKTSAVCDKLLNKNLINSTFILLQFHYLITTYLFKNMEFIKYKGYPPIYKYIHIANYNNLRP